MYLFIEMLGYLGMILVVLGFLCKDIKLLRLLNAIGAAFCCVYGLLTRTYPTMCLNAILLVINIICLINIFRKGNKNGDISK